MTSSFDSRLVRYLSATHTRSGAAIAETLGCSRTAVWKHIEALRQNGIGVHAVAGQGYRLEEPLELLEPGRIKAQLNPQVRSLLTGLAVVEVIDSTNNELQRMPVENQSGQVLLAERQEAGRGRRGQAWVSPYGRNIYLSLGWRFEAAIGELGCLPLILAISACQALEACGLEGTGIKWPNDLMRGGAKLGGCLAEVQGDMGGPCHAVLGIGINVRMPPGTQGTKPIGQPFTDVASSVPDISRNELCARLVDALVANVVRFAADGFEPFAKQWSARDLLEGEAVALTSGDQTRKGFARGVSPRGALLLETGGSVGEYHAGEVSLVRKGSPA